MSLKKKIKIKKIIGFDIDETIGYFVQFSIFCSVIEEYRRKKISQIEFNNLLDLFPEFLRYKIFDIIKYLLKNKKLYSKLFLYTNNTGNKLWPNRIKKYFEYKLSQKVFDKTICAYKVNGKQIEKCRTSYEKKYSDLMNCLNMETSTKVFFADDQIHNDMYYHKNVTYYNNNTYIFNLTPKKMLLRLKKSNIYHTIPKQYLFDDYFLYELSTYEEFNLPFKTFTLQYLNEYNLMMKELNIFIKKSSNKTIKKKYLN